MGKGMLRASSELWKKISLNREEQKSNACPCSWRKDLVQVTSHIGSRWNSTMVYMTPSLLRAADAILVLKTLHHGVATAALSSGPTGCRAAVHRSRSSFLFFWSHRSWHWKGQNVYRIGEWNHDFFCWRAQLSCSFYSLSPCRPLLADYILLLHTYKYSLRRWV